MSILIFANGDLTPGEWIQPYLDNATMVIAADGGVIHVLALGLIPDVVIGDLDSMTEPTRDALREAKVEMQVHPENKDETDLELALRYAAAQPGEEILVLGSLGGRLDQMLANVLLLNAPFLRGRIARIVDAQQEAWVMTKGHNRFIGRPGDLVSLLPLGGDVRIKRTLGLAWPLVDEALIQGMSRGISNRLTGENATVEIEDGVLLCVLIAAGWQR